VDEADVDRLRPRIGRVRMVPRNDAPSGRTIASILTGFGGVKIVWDVVAAWR
jgi:hypothetical protein